MVFSPWLTLFFLCGLGYIASLQEYFACEVGLYAMRKNTLCRAFFVSSCCA